MKTEEQRPPRLAQWILWHFGPETNQDALTGDLNETYAQGRSKQWYWRQVRAAIRWRAHIFNFCFAFAAAYALNWPGLWKPINEHLNHPLDIAITSGIFLLASYLPGMLSNILRAAAVLVTIVSFLLIQYYKLLPYDAAISPLSVLLGQLIFYRRPRTSTLTWRELIFGNPDKERERLIVNLQRSLEQTPDPKTKDAYLKSIAALQRNKPDSKT